MAAALKIFRVSLARGSPFMVGVGTQSSNAFRTQTVPLIRTYAAQAGQSKKSNVTAFIAGLAAAGAGAGFYFWATSSVDIRCRSKCDYQKVYNAIADILEENPEYDDGSYGPLLVRLAWHASGTYDFKAGNGGSNLATMRFNPEANHNANAGLHIARDKLEKIKKKFPSISYGDLWTLAGVVAVQEMGGPVIPWRPGRIDGAATDCTPDGRLPDGANPNPQHPRDVFYRMGFNDQEIVALLGAHALGRCHTDRSGFDGPWTNSPTTFTNSYFVELLGRKWVDKNWKGPKQFVDKETGQLMMLPADMVFAQDKEFRKWAETYAKDEKKFFEDFAKAWKKLLEVGVVFKEGAEEYRFKTKA